MNSPPALSSKWPTASRCLACLQIAALLLTCVPALPLAADEFDEFDEFSEEKPPETSFITFSYGAKFNPRQIHIQFVDVTLADEQRLAMISLAERDRRLRERFPELQAPLTAKLEKALDDGLDQFYFDANSTRARQTIEAAFGEIEKNLLAMSLRPDLAQKAWEAGMLLVMSIPPETEDAARDRVLARLIKLFPFVEPKLQDYPPHLIESYRKVFNPSASNAFLLRVIVKDGCWIRINGFDRPRNASTEELFVLSSKYALGQVCPDKNGVAQLDRVFVVPITREETIDFTGEFALAFDFPNDFNLNAQLFNEDIDRQVALVSTLGHRLQVKQMISAGLLPLKNPQDESMYRLLLVDIDNDRLIRERTVPLTQIATPDRMRDALDSLLTGEEFKYILPPQPPGTDWTFIGIITASSGAGLIALGVVFAILAELKQQEFIDCSADPACRSAPDSDAKRSSALQDRNQNALVANILLVTGGLAAAAGITMILVHQLSGKSEESKDDSSSPSSDPLEDYESLRDWSIGFAPSGDGGFFSFGLTF
jgi:hypothetical protein